MNLFQKKSAVAVFYYLMSVDGQITADELTCFDEIGNILDSENFSNYKDRVIQHCEKQLENIIDEEDHYEVALEGVDQALVHRADDLETGIPTRLLIWDMLVIAFSNLDYSQWERRLIKHVVRTLEPDKSVFLEMEQLMQTDLAIDRELRWIENSDRPYAEVKPVVEELNSRREVIRKCAQALIDDELFTPIDKVTLRSNPKIAKAKAAVENAVAPVAEELGEKTSKFFGDAKAKLEEAASPLADNMGKQTKKLFAGLKPRKKQESTEADASESCDTQE